MSVYEMVEIVPEDFHRRELIEFLNADIRNSIIKAYEDEIEDLYTMHYPHMVSDFMSMSIYYERQSIESLVLDITAKKNKLKKFKRKAKAYCKTVYRLLEIYNESDRTEIKNYFYSKGNKPYTDLISGFVKASYRENEAQRIEIQERLERIRKQNIIAKANKINKKKEVIRI